MKSFVLITVKLFVLITVKSSVPSQEIDNCQLTL